MAYFVLQPCDVIASVMTSSIAVLPSSMTSFESRVPVILPHTSKTTNKCTSTNCRTDRRTDNLGFHPVRDNRSSPSGDQVTWSNVEAMPYRDDVTSHLPLTSHAKHGSLDHHRMSADHAHRRDVISGPDENQDGVVGMRGGRRVDRLYCEVCHVTLNGSAQARQHFNGRTHARRARLTSSASRGADSSTHVSSSTSHFIISIIIIINLFIKKTQ